MTPSGFAQSTEMKERVSVLTIEMPRSTSFKCVEELHGHIAGFPEISKPFGDYSLKKLFQTNNNAHTSYCTD